MTTKNAVLVLLPFAALAGCATAPPAATTASATDKAVCRQIDTPAPYDTNPVYCGTAQQVAAVQSQPALLTDSEIVCQKLPHVRTGNRLSATTDAPVCMLPAEWQRSGLMARNANWNHGHSTVTEGASEYASMTVPPNPGIDVWVPPGQVPGQL